MDTPLPARDSARSGDQGGRPLRVLHVSQPTDAGVAEVVAALAADQVRRGCRVHVACPPDGDLAAVVTGVGGVLHPWPAGRSPGPASVAEAGRLSRVIRQVRPQVLHLHSSKAGLAGRLAARGRVPTVFQPHAWSFDAVTGPVRSASRWWEQRATRWTTLTLCVSADEAASGQRAGSLGRSNAVVPNGVDVHRWQPADRAEARARLGLPAEAPVAVLIGRLTRQKGQDLAVQAWPAVRAALPEALLCLVGDGPDAADLAATAEPGVRLVGRADPGDWYAASNVLLLPSRWEGMPLVALEAMACGRPVVGADVTGVAEALGDPNQLVPAERPEALAASTLALLTESDRAERIGARNRTRACQQFSVERMTQQVFQLYQDLLVR